MHSETHVFGSQRGYQCLAKSPGVSDADDQELSQFGFGQSADDRFLQGLAAHPTALGRMLPSGRFAITRVLAGELDVAGRSTLEFRTLIISVQDYLAVRAHLSALISDGRIWSSKAFRDSQPHSFESPRAAQSSPSELGWKIFDAWFSAQARRPNGVVVGSDDASAQGVVAVAGSLDPEDAPSYSWGIRLLAPIPWVDVISLSPYGATDSGRPVFGVSRGPCVNPKIESARQRNPAKLPRLGALVVDDISEYQSNPATRTRREPAAIKVNRASDKKSMLVIVPLIVTLVVLTLGFYWLMPSPPTDFVASDGESTEYVQLTWKSDPKAKGYKVYRDKILMPVQPTGAVAEFKDTTAEAGTSYTYSVRATGMVGTSQNSVDDTGCRKLTPPGGLTASDGTSTDSVELTWTASSGATGYTIYRDGAVTPIAPVGDVLVYNDTTAVPGTSHTYFVQATGVGGPSENSNDDAGCRKLIAPTGVTASDGTSTDSVELIWTASIGATGYTIYRDNVLMKDQPSGAVSKFNDTTAIPGTNYTYTVRATRDTAHAESDFSSPASGSRASNSSGVPSTPVTPTTPVPTSVPPSTQTEPLNGEIRDEFFPTAYREELKKLLIAAKERDKEKQALIDNANQLKQLIDEINHLMVNDPADTAKEREEQTSSRKAKLGKFLLDWLRFKEAVKKCRDDGATWKRNLQIKKPEAPPDVDKLFECCKFLIQARELDSSILSSLPTKMDKLDEVRKSFRNKPAPDDAVSNKWGPFTSGDQEFLREWKDYTNQFNELLNPTLQKKITMELTKVSLTYPLQTAFNQLKEICGTPTEPGPETTKLLEEIQTYLTVP